MLWDGTRVPFTLLGGYLGAGKTTILNRLLSRTEHLKLVVLVNDVGTVNVDAALIADHDGETLTLTNGCVCCGIADDFNETLEQVRSLTEPPDHIVMELSGVGEPARLAPWANTAGFRLDGVIVAADAEQIAEQVRREYVGDTVRSQLDAAHVVALTKLDLAADEGATAQSLVASMTQAPIVRCVDGELDPSVVLGVGGRSVAPVPSGSNRHVVTTQVAPCATRADLESFVSSLGPDVVRAKGLVVCTDSATVVEVQRVGTRTTTQLRPDLATDSATGEIVVIEAPLHPSSTSGEEPTSE